MEREGKETEGRAGRGRTIKLKCTAVEGEVLLSVDWGRRTHGNISNGASVIYIRSFRCRLRFQYAAANPSLCFGILPRHPKGGTAQT